MYMFQKNTLDHPTSKIFYLITTKEQTKLEMRKTYSTNVYGKKIRQNSLISTNRNQIYTDLCGEMRWE